MIERSAHVRPDGADNWFSHVSRMTHEIFIEAPWLPDRSGEFDPQRYADALADADIEAVEFWCKDHNGVCYYQTAHGPSFARDLVGPVVAALHRRDIRVFGYVSAGYDAFALAHHPDWRIVDRSGRPRILQPPLEMVCFRSPYRDYLLRQVADLVSAYPVDGLWLDIIPLAWPGPHTDTHRADAEVDFFMVHDVPLPCVCASCRGQFVAEHGRPIPTDPTADDMRLLFDFGVHGARRLLADARDLLRRHRPGALFSYNGSGCPGDPIDMGDIVSIEAHAPNHLFQSFVARWARGRGRPVEVMTPGALESWLTPHVKPRSLLQLETKIAAAHGGTAVIGRVILRDGSWDQAALDDISSAYRAVGDPTVPGTELRPWSEVLLASTIDAARAPAQWGPMMAGLEFWHTVLLQEHVQYDIGDLRRDLRRYRLIVLADQRAMSDDEASAIREYLRDGGAIVVTGETGLYDKDGSRRPAFAIGDCLGVVYKGHSGLPYAYVSPGPALGAELSRRQLIVKREPMVIDVGAGDVVAWALAPGVGSIDPYLPAWGFPEADADSPPLPFITVNRFGEGSSAYVAAALDDGPRTSDRATSAAFESVWWRELAKELVRQRLGMPALRTDAPAGIEMVLHEAARGYVVDLIDHTCVTPTWTTPDPGKVGERQVTLRLDRTRLGDIREVMVAGERLDAVIDGDWLVVTVPPFAIHTRVAIHPENQ